MDPIISYLKDGTKSTDRKEARLLRLKSAYYVISAFLLLKFINKDDAHYILIKFMKAYLETMLGGNP